ncbi:MULTISPECIES: ROK family protein [unclassified Oceanispirochaeta]|uniref:ROK family protein n=1 Tax=unclassified Oceanispirochaeta TaxID=2635722 RepID=UPI000E092E4E|nr:MULTISPECIES: ROK family protein [unclassified Oceanispirochaeta]MBF9016474.1 ROK family protein [Oceanispirochaeta sp. M2]NPD72936.1 ROK family protein [Oceanispirochaeta sp. M1]RDG31511.1 ROK family protein [Oceanispirochaeta sp. M1]
MKLNAVRRNRIVNTSRIIREIWTARSISRVDLSRKLDLNKSTVTNIVSNMLDNKLVLETTEGPSTPQGGRKPVRLEINRNYGYILGFEIRPESYTVVAVDILGDILFSRTESIDISSKNFKEIFFKLQDDLEKELTWIGRPLIGIGIGCSGIIDAPKRIIRASIPLHFTEPFDFYKEIACHSKVPVYIDNDANSCAWGELTFHRTQNLQNFLFCLIEFRDIAKSKAPEQTAIGMGIAINGNVYYGRNSSAGEFRSIFSSKAKEAGQLSLNYAKDSPIMEEPEIIEHFIRELSQHLALFVNTFNLSQVFLGGDLGPHMTERFRSVLNEEIRKNWPYDDQVDCEVRFSTLGDKSVAYGAAGLVMNRIFIDLEVLEAEDVERFGSLELVGNDAL